MRPNCRIATAVSLAVILVVAITVVATPWWDRVEQGQLRRVLRQRQRPLHRRRGPHTRRRRRNGRGDRPAARPREGHLLGRFGVPGACRCAGSDPVAVARQRAGDPARPCLLRWSETGCGHSHSAGPHRGSRRVGRLPRSSWRSSPTPCSPPRRAGRARSASSSTPPRPTCAARVRPRATRSSNSPKRFRRSAITAPTSSARCKQPAVAGIRADVEQRSARRVQHEPCRRHHGAVQHAQRGGQRDAGAGRRGQRPARLRRRQPGRASASPSTGSTRSRTALNDSRGDVKQVLHITPTVFQNFMNIYQPCAERGHRHPGARQLRQHRAIHLQRNPGRVSRWVSSSRRSSASSTWRRSSRTASTTSRRWASTRSSEQSARPNEITYSEDRLNPNLPPARPPTRPLAAEDRCPDADRSEPGWRA